MIKKKKKNGDHSLTDHLLHQRPKENLFDLLYKKKKNIKKFLSVIIFFFFSLFWSENWIWICSKSISDFMAFLCPFFFLYISHIFLCDYLGMV